MNVAWGLHLSSETKGLDVLGIRALDQNIEASLTNGITTISNSRPVHLHSCVGDWPVLC